MIKEHSVATKSDTVKALGLSIIIVSSILLGIWATRDTIALRNVLLILGTALSVIYIGLELKLRNVRLETSLNGNLPLVLICLIFIWVISHYFFLSRHPELQFGELKSTWLRSAFSVILGLGTGLAIRNNPRAMTVLWLGILASFAILFVQYVPIAIANNNLFAPDHYGPSYIYLAKINGVLMGTILIAGLTGTLIDNWRRTGSQGVFFSSMYWLIGVLLVMYSYVYIFMARNGIGLAALLFASWLIVGTFLLKDKLKKRTILIPKFAFVSVFIVITLFGWLGMQHVKSTPGWSSLIDDVRIAVQIEKYPNWRDPATLGYPRNENGNTVAINTYERAAWAVAGATIFLPENPFGIGTLHRPYPRLLLEKYGKDVSYIPSTHSAWIEFGLAFGYPIIFLLLSTVIILTVRSVRKQFTFSATSFSISIAILLTYTVGELSTAHAVEILFYWIAFVFAIQTMQPKKLP